VTSYINNCRWI